MVRSESMNATSLRARLATLSDPWCSASLIQELLGIDLPGDPRLSGALRAWSERFRGDPDVERSSGVDRLVHRHALEIFLLQNGWVSWKWAAVVRVGSTTASSTRTSRRSLPRFRSQTSRTVLVPNRIATSVRTTTLAPSVRS